MGNFYVCFKSLTTLLGFSVGRPYITNVVEGFHRALA